MSDQRKRYRSVFLHRNTAADNFRSETIDITVDGETLPVEVCALSIGEYSATEVPDRLVEKLGEQTAMQLTLICKCTFIPGTDERIWNPPKSDDDLGDAVQMADAPMSGGGPFGRIYQAINYVHGFRTEPPAEIQDPRLQEISEAADHLKDIAEGDDEELNAPEVASIAEMIGSRIRWIDSGSRTGK